jgi:type I restriction enzyme M protein
MYDNAFNTMEKNLRAKEGISNELDYVEQTSWLLFLKYLHDLEIERQDRAELTEDNYKLIIQGDSKWDKWASPKSALGDLDHNSARVGEDLVSFVDTQLFPYLANFKDTEAGPKSIQYKIGEVIGELRNKFRSRYILRDIIETIDTLSFNTQDERLSLPPKTDP